MNNDHPGDSSKANKGSSSFVAFLRDWLASVERRLSSVQQNLGQFVVHSINRYRHHVSCICSREEYTWVYIHTVVECSQSISTS